MVWKITFLLATAAFANFAAYAQGTVATLAGTDWVFPASANSGRAIDAPLISVDGVAVDSDGTIFAADSNNNFVVRITTGGVLTIVAGTGVAGVSSDGIAATSATLSFISAVALDASGNLYLTDGNRVRTLTPEGIIRTVAGNGSNNYPFGDGGPAIYASINSPHSLAFDAAGNLYIAENQGVRKVDTNGVISTVVKAYGLLGTGAQLGFAQTIALDAKGTLYISDLYNHRVWKADGSGNLSAFAGNGEYGVSGDGGPAISAQLRVGRIALDPAGNLYIGDGDTIRKVTPDGIISTIAQLKSLYLLARDSTGFYLAGSVGQLFKMGPNGAITLVAGSGTQRFFGDGGPAINAQLGWPDGVVVGPDGSVYISDSTNNRIRKVVPDGIITTVAGTASYGFSGDGGPATSAQLHYPRGLALDAVGALYVADVSNSRIRKINPDGTIRTVAGNGKPGFSGDGGPATEAQLYYPQGVAIDSTTGNLYIADSANYRIRMVTPQGTISTVVGNGQNGFSGDGGSAVNSRLSSPSAVAVDAGGSLYIVDSTVCYPAPCATPADTPYLSNQRIRKVDIRGVISTIAGNGEDGFSGDGGPATSAALCFPEGVAMDAAGNVYILDSGNNRIRKIDSKGTISTVAISPGRGRSGYAGLGLSVDDYLKSGGAVAVDSAGSLYIADLLNYRVLKVTGPATPFFLHSAVVNAASLLLGSPNVGLAPGAIVSIFGQNLATGLQSASPPLPTLLLDSRVTIDNLPVPLLFVSPGQINAQIPFEVSLGMVPIEVRRTSTGGATSSLLVSAVAPGIFTIERSGQGAIVTSSGEIAAPDGSLTALSARPARRGEYVSIFLTGLGAVTNQPASGAPGPSQTPISETILKPTVMIGGVAATPVFSGLAPFFAGVYQVNVQIPDDAPTGDKVQVMISIGGATSNTVTIAVR